MALLKVRDEEIFQQVLKEVEVDYAQKVQDIKHEIRQSEKVTDICEKQEFDQWKLVNKIIAATR